MQRIVDVVVQATNLTQASSQKQKNKTRARQTVSVTQRVLYSYTKYEIRKIDIHL